MEYVFPVLFLTLVAVLFMCVVLICYFEFLKPQIHEPAESYVDNNGAIYDEGNVTHRDNDFQLDTLRNIDNTDFITNLTECDSEFRNTCTVHDTIEHNTDTTKHYTCNTDSNNCVTICHNASCENGDTGRTSCDIGHTGNSSYFTGSCNYDSCIPSDSGTTNFDTYDSGNTNCDTGTTSYDSSTTNYDICTTNDE